MVLMSCTLSSQISGNLLKIPTRLYAIMSVCQENGHHIHLAEMSSTIWFPYFFHDAQLTNNFVNCSSSLILPSIILQPWIKHLIVPVQQLYISMHFQNYFQIYCLIWISVYRCCHLGVSKINSAHGKKQRNSHFYNLVYYIIKLQDFPQYCSAAVVNNSS